MCVGLIGSASVKKNAVNKITFNKRFNKNLLIKPLIVVTENSLVYINLVERDYFIKQNKKYIERESNYTESNTFMLEHFL